MTRASWERIDVLFRFLVTGGKALAFGLALWFLLLAVSASVWLIETPGRMDHRIHWLFRWFHSGWGLGIIYGSSFFFAAMLSARSHWSCYPALAAFLAYAIFVLIVLPDQPPSPESDFWCFLTPLLTAPAGGWLGGRIFRHLHR
jgi:hypothetical protein